MFVTCEVIQDFIRRLLMFVTYEVIQDFKILLGDYLYNIIVIIKGRSPSNDKLSDFSFYIDSQKSAHRKFKK